jgi:hypothetical protein
MERQFELACKLVSHLDHDASFSKIDCSWALDLPLNLMEMTPSLPGVEDIDSFEVLVLCW